MREWVGEEPNLNTTESLALYRSLILFGVWCIPRHFGMQICESTYFARTGAHLSEHGTQYQAWRRLSEIMNAYILKKYSVFRFLLFPFEKPFNTNMLGLDTFFSLFRANTVFFIRFFKI